MGHVFQGRYKAIFGQHHAQKSAKPLAHYARKFADRDTAIVQAYASGGYGMKEIGEYFGLHYSRVSRILADRRKAKGKT